MMRASYGSVCATRFIFDQSHGISRIITTAKPGTFTMSFMK